MPTSRGPFSATLFDHLRHPVHEVPHLPDIARTVLADDDAMLSLYVLYELHYRGFDGVDARWEWEPSLLRERQRLEAAFESDLRELVGSVQTEPGAVTAALRAAARSGSGPSLSGWFAEHGTRDEMREFAIHRSAYQLKEADPHTWAIPRLHGRAKAALVTIQRDEYGDGDARRMHSALFARTMEALDLDPAYGAYLDRIPAVTLATVNLMSLFGLHRRWRGALVGHLALFEMCSVTPMSRYAAALRRLGDGDAAEFYDVHVEADARHEIVAQHELAGALALDEPDLASDIVFGALALDATESAFARHLLDSWIAGRSSLRSC